jgi:hypothetical protein
VGNALTTGLSGADQSGPLTVPLDQLDPLKPKAKPLARTAAAAPNSVTVSLDQLEPAKPKTPSVSLDSVYGKPPTAPRAENPFGVSSAAPAAMPTPTAAAARVTEPLVNLAPPENPKPPSEYWQQEWAARQRDIEKINQAEQTRQAREGEERARQNEISRMPFMSRAVESMLEPSTTLGTILRQSAPQEKPPEFESDYFRHRVKEAEAQGKSAWDDFPHSMTEFLLRAQVPEMKPAQARQAAEPFTQPLLDVPTATGHTDQPFAAGAERAAGGFTSPENVALLGALGGLDAAAQSGAGLIRLAPRVMSGLFATQMGAGLVHSAREYQALKAAGDDKGAQQILGSAFVQVPLALLTASHSVSGLRAPMKAEELLDSVHSADVAAQTPATGPATAAAQAPAATGATPPAPIAAPQGGTVPLADVQPSRPGSGTLFDTGPENRSVEVLRRVVADESLPAAVRDAARAEMARAELPPSEKPAAKFEAKPPEPRQLAKVEATPFGRQQAQSYVNLVKDVYTREYAQSYLDANLKGGDEPDRGSLSPLDAAAIRRSIDTRIAKEPTMPVAEKYSPEILEDAKAELAAAHDLASSFERPGRYHADLGPEANAKEQDKAWYGVSSSRDIVAQQFPWYSDESVTPAKLADAAMRGKGANYERIVDRIAEHLQAQREEAKPVIEEFGPQLETLAAQVRDVDPELATTLLDIRSGRYASLRDLPAFIEGKVADAQRAAEFSRAFDELAEAEGGNALPESAPASVEPHGGSREAGGREEAPRSELAPLEVPLDQLAPLPEPQPINPQEVEDMSRQLGRPVTAEELPEIRRRLEAERNVEAGLRGERRDVAGEIREEHRTKLERGEKQPALPGMTRHVAAQKEGAARVQSEQLTAQANAPRNIERAAGELETKSPVFRGTAASPQAEIFGQGTPEERGYADAGKKLGIEYRGVIGADMGLGDKAAVIYQDPESKTSIGVKVGEWSPERVEEKLRDARARMAGGETLYGGLGFLDPELIRKVMPESIKNALGDTVPIGEREAGIVREKTGELARKREQMFQQYADGVARWEKRPVKEGQEFILREQHGDKQPNAADQEIADQLQKEFAARRKAVEDLSHGSFDHWQENYFPQMWERPNQVADFIKQRILGGKRPLQGSAGFKKARVFDDLQEGLDAGYKPVTNNPVSMALLKLHEMDRYTMAHEILGQSLKEDLAKFVRFGDAAPAGWTRVNDSMFRVLQPSEEAQGMVLRGEYFMPSEAARVLNNYLAPGLRGNPLYDVFRGAGNTLNQAQLGFSAFHAMFSGLNSTISDFALALRKASQLSITEAAKAATRAVPLIASPIRHVITGTKLMREYLSPGKYADYSELADAVAKGGGRIFQDPLYRNASIAKFWKAWGEGDWKRVGLQAFPAALEKMASPVMEHLVPRLKLGAFADIARDSLDRLPPGASKTQIRATLDKAWDSVDNRFGQVVYDNLFLNKTLKDLGLVSVRSLGWNLGTVREIGGAAKDTAKAAGRAFIGERPELTNRMAYTLALPIVTGYIGALVNYAYTGEGPKETKDYFFPRTGRTLANGEPERISLPTYMKDVYAFVKHPLITAGHKVHPLISMIADMLENKDFYGVEIRHADDPLVKQIGQLVGYAAEQASPLSYRNLKQRAQAEGRPGIAGTLREAVSPSGLQSFFGITPAPTSVTHTAAEEKALSLLEEHRPKGTRTSEEYEHQARRSYLRGEVSAGRMQPRDLAAHVQAGEVTAKEAGDILRQVRESPIVHFTRGLSLDDFLSVWDVANSREQEQLRPLLLSKRHLVAELPADERKAISARLNEAIAARPKAPYINRQQ